MQISNGRGKRILIADDDRAVREVIKLVLSHDGYSVAEAADGAEALVQFQHDDFALVITDFEMPRLRGDALVDAIRRLAPGQPIIMVSANLHRMGNRLSTVNGFLDKPFMVAELRSLVDGVIGACDRGPGNEKTVIGQESCNLS